MITTNTHRIALALAVAASVLAGAAAHATVMVDVNGNGDTTAAGWTGWDPVNPNNSALDTGTGVFSSGLATDGDVDVRITTSGSTFERNYGVDNVTGAFSAATPAELWQDQYFHNSTAGAPLTVTLNDLKAGNYAFTIYNYHDDLNTGGNAGGGTAITDIFVATDVFNTLADSGVDATAYAGNDGSQAAAFLESNAAATVNFTVASDNAPVTIEYRNPTANHFGLNGFKLVDAGWAPEAQTLQVDFDAAGGPTQSGWNSWNPTHTDNTALNDTKTFAAPFATDSDVDFTISTASDTYERDYADIGSGAFAGHSDLLTDIVFFNQAAGEFFQIVIDDLTAGDYTFRAFHHSTNALGGLATMDILLNGVDTTEDVQMTLGNAPSAVATSLISFTVANDGDQVIIRYDDADSNHFGLNGFELTKTPTVPAPAALPAGLAMLTLVATRRRRT